MSDSPTFTEPLGLRLYRKASRAARPVAEYALKRRLKAGKEDPDRINERRGVAGAARPEGSVFWIHGASVGESLSVLPLIRALKAQRPEFHFLVTTGTVTSAQLMSERLPEGAIHQFIPLDHPEFISAFLDHWRPDAAVFIESEFWPNLILEARRAVPFMAVVNGRVSPKSYEDWRKKPQTIGYVLSAFDLIIAQDSNNAERLQALSGRDVSTFGNLKNAAAPLPAQEADLEMLRTQIGARPVWLAASTHPGEEEAVIVAHQALGPALPSRLTLLAPRHPERGDEIAALAAQAGIEVAQRSKSAPITPDTGIYIADTLGELGLFYRLSDIAFVGGSLTDKGGHNPLEPARIGGAILHGPHTFNFAETYDEMRRAGGTALVRNDRELSGALSRLLADEKTRRAMADAARACADANAERVLTDVSAQILSHLSGDSASK